MARIGVIGAGAWGTALAVQAIRAGNDVTLWTRNEEVLSFIKERHINKRYLPTITLPSTLTVTNNLEQACEADLLLCVVPAQQFRNVCMELAAANIAENLPIVICAKGIEHQTGYLMHQVAQEVLPSQTIAVLSGPNFADEVGLGVPSATTLACENIEEADRLAAFLHTDIFRVYTSSDVVGVQIGGAVKNVLAIACGIAAGRQFGENTRAALITRGVAEISRLCAAQGGDVTTLLGLAGVGDIMLTCTSPKSRNMSLGMKLGQGKSLEDILANRKAVTEGVASAMSVYELAKKHDIEMPICTAVYGILHKNVPIDEAMQALMHRSPSHE